MISVRNCYNTESGRTMSGSADPLGSSACELWLVKMTVHEAPESPIRVLPPTCHGLGRLPESLLDKKRGQKGTRNWPDRRTILRVTVPTLITPSGAGFPNTFFKNEFLLLHNRLKLKKIILTRRGGSDGARPAPFFAAIWWDSRCAIIWGQNVKFW